MPQVDLSINNDVRECLEEMARQHELLYKGRPSLTKIIDKIIRENFLNSPQNQESLQIHREHNLGDMVVRLQVPTRLRGVIATLMKVFTEQGVAVSQLIEQDQQEMLEAPRGSLDMHGAYAYMLIDLMNHKKLTKLIEKLTELKVSDLTNYNNSSAILEAANRFWQIKHDSCEIQQVNTFPLVNEIHISLRLEIGLKEEGSIDKLLVEFAKQGLIVSEYQYRTYNDERLEKIYRIKLAIHKFLSKELSEYLHKGESKDKSLEEQTNYLFSFIESKKIKNTAERPKFIGSVKILKSQLK